MFVFVFVCLCVCACVCVCVRMCVCVLVCVLVCVQIHLSYRTGFDQLAAAAVTHEEVQKYLNDTYGDDFTDITQEVSKTPRAPVFVGSFLLSV